MPGVTHSMMSQREHARASAVTAAELMTTPLDSEFVDLTAA